MKDIFAALSKLKLSFNGLRPFQDNAPMGEPGKLALVNARLERCKGPYEAFINTLASLYPFVQKDIYDQMEQCAGVVYTEMRDMHDAGAAALSVESYSTGERRRVDFERKYRQTAESVRTRFEHLLVIR